MNIKGIIFGLAAAATLFAQGGTKIIKNGDTLVFAGDSITKFGNESEQGYVRLVIRGLAANGINVTYYGRGHSGWTASGIRGSFQDDVINSNPQVCTIFAGVNDCGQGWTKEKGGSSTPDDVSAMVDMALAAGIKPVVLSPTGVNGEDFKQNVCDYAAAVKQIAQNKGIPYAATYESYRAYIDDPTTPKFNSQYKAASDGTHMSPIGNRIIAREVLKAFGFDSTEMAKVEAAWNAVPDMTSMHPSVKITDGEYKAMKVAAEAAGKSLGAYHLDLFARGVELMVQNKAKVSATSGAAKQCSVSLPVSYAQIDGLIEVGRAMTDHDSVPSIANYALLAAVHELPAVTDADLPKEPVTTVDTSVFSKQVEFTCSGYTGSSTLSDFPVLVRLAADNPTDFAYTDMNDSTKGDELRFADDEGNALPYEIESWNPTGTSLVWVKVPSITAATTFRMYYGGDPTDTVATRWTWQAGDYVGVWHMADEIDWDVNNGVVTDSMNGLDAKPIGAYPKTMQSVTDGVFGKARVNSTKDAEYQGQSMLEINDSTLLDLDCTFTFSGWIKMTNLSKSGLGRIVSRSQGSNYAPQWELRMSDYTTLQAYSDSNTAVSGTVPSAQNAWVQIVGVFNGTTFTAYANGSQVFQQTISASPNSDYRLIFGAKDDALPTGHFVGVFDEFRLRGAVSSADWVKAEYDQSKTTFLSASDATDVTGGQTHTHTWGTPSYTWTQTASGYECKATVVCTSVSSHTKSTTVTATYSVVTPATADADGLGRYTATFTTAPFTSVTTKDVVIDKTGGGTVDPGQDDPPHVDPSGAISPSGVTSGATDTSVIQAAIDNAAANGTVTLGSGIFYINTQLMVTNGVKLVGQGWEKTIIKQTASAGTNTRVVTVDGGATVKGVTLTGGQMADKWSGGSGAGAMIKDGTISWCCITNNMTGVGAATANNLYGGAVSIYEGKGQIDHTIIADNNGKSNYGDAYGGGIGIRNPIGEVLVDTCLIYGNVIPSGKGGGIYANLNNSQIPVTIRNTTIANNSASKNGGALFAETDYYKKLSVVNCVFDGNVTTSGEVNFVVPNSASTTYCLFDVEADMVGANSKVGAAGFTNAAAGDYTLTENSPAKGAGVTYSGIGKDLSGASFANPPSMGCYEYGSSTPTPPAGTVTLGDATATPQTDYNGSAVTVAFTGDIPEDASVSAKVTINGHDYNGTVNGKTVSVSVPDGAVTAGNTYTGKITLTVGSDSYTKDVTLAQGTLKVDADANWIKESSSSFKSTGSWSGDKAVVASGKISVSNATFTASKAAPKDAVVTVETSMDFNEALDAAVGASSRAGIWVVKVSNVYRYAVKTATGVVTNTTAVATVGSAVSVKVVMDNAAKTVAYTVGGTTLGTYAMAAKSEGVKTVRYIGATEVSSLTGGYRFEGLDANVAKAGDVEYVTVAEALASGTGAVSLLWDASWIPAYAGEYTIAKGGHELVIGGDLAYTVKDNGNGSVTVTVGGTPAPKKPHVIFYVD